MKFKKITIPANKLLGNFLKQGNNHLARIKKKKKKKKKIQNRVGNRLLNARFCTINNFDVF